MRAIEGTEWDVMDATWHALDRYDKGQATEADWAQIAYTASLRLRGGPVFMRERNQKMIQRCVALAEAKERGHI